MQYIILHSEDFRFIPLADFVQFVLEKFVLLLLHLEFSSILVLAGCLCYFQLVVLLLKEFSLLGFTLKLVSESLNLVSDFSDISFIPNIRMDKMRLV